VRDPIGPAGGRFQDLQGKKLRSLLAHHPIAEIGATLRNIQQCLGAIHISIGTIHQFEPKTAEAVRIPDTTMKIEVPSLQLSEIKRVLLRQVRVATKKPCLVWAEIEPIQLLLIRGSIVFDNTGAGGLELLRLNKH